MFYYSASEMALVKYIRLENMTLKVHIYLKFICAGEIETQSSMREA